MKKIDTFYKGYINKKKTPYRQKSCVKEELIILLIDTK